MSASPVGCIWCGVRLSKPTLARRDGKVWALSYLGTTYARAEEAEATRRSTAARDRFWVCWALEEWEVGPGREGQGVRGERKRNGRGERKLERHEKATKDKRINQSSVSINYKIRQEMRQT